MDQSTALGSSVGRVSDFGNKSPWFETRHGHLVLGSDSPTSPIQHHSRRRPHYLQSGDTVMIFDTSIYRFFLSGSSVGIMNGHL